VRDPRLAATAVGLLLGRRGRALVSRLRAARHARGDQLVYADEGAQA
jgi:hypothetical protein